MWKTRICIHVFHYLVPVLNRTDRRGKPIHLQNWNYYYCVITLSVGTKITLLFVAVYLFFSLRIVYDFIANFGQYRKDIHEACIPVSWYLDFFSHFRIRRKRAANCFESLVNVSFPVGLVKCTFSPRPRDGVSSMRRSFAWANQLQCWLLICVRWS